MRYDRDFGPRAPRSGSPAGDEYGGPYEGPYPRHGFERGFLGGSMRSRGSWYAGTRQSGNEYDEPRDEFGFTNYDLEHGYATGRRLDTHAPRGGRLREGETEFSSPASRGGYAWGESEAAEEYGPARYGYGPYFQRLRRRRRPDEEIRHEVEETLFFDTWVDADAITVSVADGVVTLQGTLPSYDELRFAVDDAWDVEGVRGVRSQLDVDEGRGQGQGGAFGREQRQQPSPTLRGRQDPGPGDEWERHLHGHPHAGESEREDRTASQPEGNARADQRAVERDGGLAGAAGASGSGSAGQAERSGRRRGSKAQGGSDTVSTRSRGGSGQRSRSSAGGGGSARGQGRGRGNAKPASPATGQGGPSEAGAGTQDTGAGQS